MRLPSCRIALSHRREDSHDAIAPCPGRRAPAPRRPAVCPVAAAPADPRGYRIPDPLWAEALRLVQVLPLTRVAQQLGLKPHALKRRQAERGRAVVPSSPPPSPRFVEVTTGAWCPATAEVEVQRPDGARLRILYRDPAPVLTPLLQTFMESR
jgi:hypothetical protein